MGLAINTFCPITQKWIKTALFVLGGAAAGFLYFKYVDCKSGGCAITSSMSNTIIYFSLIGLWLSFVFNGGCCCGGGCNIKHDKKEEE